MYNDEKIGNKIYRYFDGNILCEIEICQIFLRKLMENIYMGILIYPNYSYIARKAINHKSIHVDTAVS